MACGRPSTAFLLPGLSGPPLHLVSVSLSFSSSSVGSGPPISCRQALWGFSPVSWLVWGSGSLLLPVLVAPLPSAWFLSSSTPCGELLP